MKIRLHPRLSRWGEELSSGGDSRNDSWVSFRYSSSLRNLSTLQLMGSDSESRNYVAMLTSILSRLAKEDTSTSCDWWSPMQDMLISAVCQSAVADQVGPGAKVSVSVSRDLVRRLGLGWLMCKGSWVRTTGKKGHWVGTGVSPTLSPLLIHLSNECRWFRKEKSPSLLCIILLPFLQGRVT